MNFIGLVFMSIGNNWLANGDNIVSVSVASIVVGDHPLYGYAATLAAHDVAVLEARRRFPRIFQDFEYFPFHSPGSFATCEESAGEMLVLLTQLYNETVPSASNGFRRVRMPTVTMSPGIPKKSVGKRIEKYLNILKVNFFFNYLFVL